MIENNAFCVLPFIHKYKKLSGIETLCCYSNTPVSNITEIRQKLLKGERISNCQLCYNQEKEGIDSARIRENKRWLMDPEIKEYIDNYNINNEDIIFSYDLRFDNTCNLACIGCSPINSTLWEKELNIQTKRRPYNFNIKDYDKIKSIYIAGGEPFLSEPVINLLKEIIKHEDQPFISINTNLTVQTDEFKTICEKLKKLTIIVSIDGVRRIAEYHRYPIKWTKFLRNLLWIKNLNCNIMFNTVINAVTVPFIHEIMEYEDISQNWNIHVLHTPYQLQIENLPEIHKQMAFDNFSQMKNSKYYSEEEFRKTVDVVLNKIWKQGYTDKLSEFITTLDNRRNINHSDYLGISLT